MNKQEQIKEIEKEYKEWAVDLLKVRFDLKPEAFDEHHKNNYSFENCADCLWNKIKGSIEELLLLKENQLPENAVVLTRERFEHLCDLAYFNGGEEEIYKETAKEILTAIGNITVGGLMTKLKYDMDFRNICTKYGVEVE